MSPGEPVVGPVVRAVPWLILAALPLVPGACGAPEQPAIDREHATRPPPPAIAGPVSLPAAAQAPAPDSVEWRELIGDYVANGDTVIVRERDGAIEALLAGRAAPVAETDFERAADGLVQAVRIADRRYERLRYGTEAGGTFRVRPVRPVDALRVAALAAEPPREEGEFRRPDLVDLATRDPTLRFEIRYATTDNFMGTALYDEPRAFLQRPAGEALVRSHRRLAEHGLGLLIYDAYRPWYITWIFWQATPPGQRMFVANPALGSRHNRGAAVDLTLHDLATGQTVPMPSGYDEFSPRAFPGYPGGTTEERRNRDLLREVMEAEGFRVYHAEWWHFDYRDWRQYPIMNVAFDELGSP
jgi:D-alanyl-D-alanine dipeptidase